MSLSTLRLTDGTTTLNLIDGTNYQLQQSGWQPIIPQRRQTILAGGDAYDEREETVTLNIFGASLATLSANVRALWQFADQVRRWADGEPGIASIRLELALNGSSVGTLESVVARITVELPDDYADLLMVNDLKSVKVRLLLRSPLVVNASPETVSASSVSTYSVATLTWGSSWQAANPLGVLINSAAVGTGTDPTWLLLAQGANDIQFIDIAPSTAPSAPWSLTTDTLAYNGARNLTYTATGTGSSIVRTYTDTANVMRTFLALLQVRNGSGTVSLTVSTSAGSVTQTATLIGQSTFDATRPAVRFLPFLFVVGGQITGITITTAHASTVTGTFNFNFLVLFNLLPPSNHALRLPLSGGRANVIRNRALYREFAHTANQDTTLAPTTANNNVGFEGDLAITTWGGNSYVALLASDGFDPGNGHYGDWRPGAGTAVPANYTLGRRRAYLQPE